MEGYVKLYRSINSNELLDNDNNALVVFVKILTKANRLTGTYTTGRNKLAVACNLKPTTLYGVLKRLESSSVVRLKSDRNSTTIYICNWWKYQQDTDSKPSQARPSDDTKQEKKENIDTKVSRSSSDELDSAHKWIGALFDKNPSLFKLTPKRKQKLKLRLSELGKDRFKQAYKSIAESPHHRGENASGWKVDDDPYWLIENAERAEKWANKYEEVEASSAPVDLTKVEINV